MKNTKKNKEILVAAMGLESVRIIGAGEALHDAIGTVKLKDHDVVLVMDEIPIKTIEICGVKYQERERENKKTGMSKSVLMAAALSGYYGQASTPRKRPVVNLEVEFELIQNKKSNLSRSDRDWVCNKFHEKYKQI